MIFDDQKHGFEQFIERWDSGKEYILFGASNVCEQLIRLSDNLLEDHQLKIKCIVDSDHSMHGVFNSISAISGHSPFQNYKHNNRNSRSIDRSNREIRVADPYSVLNENSGIQIIITSDYYYQEITAFLAGMGLEKYVDFCSYRDIAAIWPLIYKKKIHIWRTDILLTSKCTLKCKNCNMYMTFYDKPANKPLENIKSDLDIYFSRVDYVSIFHLVGGEPFLYPQLDEVITYIGENYRDKIDMLLLTSNGTIIPEKVTLDLLKKYGVLLHISDYTGTVNYRKTIDNLTKILDHKTIDYQLRRSDSWLDFGNPLVSMNLNKTELTEHFDRCTAQFRGLHDAKLYYCHLNCSAVIAGIFPDSSNDFIELKSNLPPEELLKFDLGFTKQGYITFCQNCNGCNTGINVPVKAALQA